MTKTILDDIAKLDVIDLSDHWPIKIHIKFKMFPL